MKVFFITKINNHENNIMKAVQNVQINNSIILNTEKNENCLNLTQSPLIKFESFDLNKFSSLSQKNCFKDNIFQNSTITNNFYEPNFLYKESSPINKNNYLKFEDVIKSHMNENKLTKKFACDLCDKEFTRKDNLKRHKDIEHSDFKGKICQYCGRLIKRINEHEKICQLRYNAKKLISKKFKIRKKFYKHSKRKEKKFINELKSDSKGNNMVFSLFDKVKSKFKRCGDFIYFPNYIIGSGGNMNVFFGKNTKNNEFVVVKIDKNKDRKPSTLNEANILKKLNENKNIPSLKGFSTFGKENFLIENLFGPSLDKIIKFTDKEFDCITISFLGIQMINVLENIHEKYVIHNDIKPSNICWGLFNKGKLIELNKFSLIDFGYSREIDINSLLFHKSDGNNNIEEKIHYEDKKERRFQGTPKFMAIPKSQGFRPSRRTDLEELIYTLIFLLKRSLPWSGIKGKSHEEICEKMGKIKNSISPEILFQGLPEELKFMYKIIVKLNFDERPDYGLFIILFENILRNLKVNPHKDFIDFCFIKKIKEIIKKEYEKKSSLKKLIRISSLLRGYPLNIYFE